MVYRCRNGRGYAIIRDQYIIQKDKPDIGHHHA